MNERAYPIPQGRDHEARSRFAVWASIYGTSAGYLALVSGQRAGTRLVSLREVFFRYPAQVETAAQWVDFQARHERELYHAAHLLTRPPRRKRNAAPVSSLYADVDSGEIVAGVPEPTLVVESSPGRLQAYWGLTHPLPPAQAEQLNRRLAHVLAADASGWDLTQLLRIPGTRNWKYPDAPLVSVLALTGTRYDPAALEATLPPAPARAAPTSAAPAGETMQTTALPLALSRPARAVWNGEDVRLTSDGRVDRSLSLLRLARVLYEAGLSGALLTAALAERDEALGWQKYTGRRDAAEQYQRLAELVEQGTRTKRRTSW